MTSGITANFNSLVPATITATSNALRIFAWISVGAHTLLAVGIAADILAGRRQQIGIMNIVWPITCLYGGVFALWAYWSFGRANNQSSSSRTEQRSGPPRPMWQSVVLGTAQSGAGSALGDILCEGGLYWLGLTSLLGSALLTAYVFDFAAAYILALIFQSLVIATLGRIAPLQSLWSAVKAETLSLVAFQVGLFAWMTICQAFIFRPALQPNSPVFWFMMQIAMIVGFMMSFPVNWWLIQRGIKEPM